MSSMCKHLESQVNQQEVTFYSEIAETIKKQQEAIEKDHQTKVPGFLGRLQQKYVEL